MHAQCDPNTPPHDDAPSPARSVDQSARRHPVSRSPVAWVLQRRSRRAALTSRGVARLRAGAANQAGFTLVELLVVLPMAVLVFGTVLTFADSGQRIAKNDSERALAVVEAQTGLYRMTHELRQGYAPSTNCTQPCAVAPTNTNSLDVIVGSLRVRYDCSVISPTNSSYRECCRYASTTLTESPTSSGSLSAKAPCGQGGTRVIDRVTGPTYVFQPPASATEPTNYTAEIQVPEKGEYTAGYPGTIDLSDGIYLRNVAGDL
jgi:Tfp pilus assembly protein PilX